MPVWHSRPRLCEFEATQPRTAGHMVVAPAGFWSIMRLLVMEKAVSIILFLVWITTMVGIPVMLAWGWVRWAKRKQPLTLPGVLSAAGFALATGSALLAIAMTVYAQ